MIDNEMRIELEKPIPGWAVSQHPTKPNRTVIHPMAVVDRLNSVFGFGQWMFSVEFISCDKSVQKTQRGDRDVYVSMVKGILEIPEHSVYLEQFGGSTNDDGGDALKGGATDALTKIASYLGICASIYRGHGNISATDDTNNVPQTQPINQINQTNQIRR